jgi:FixJ family two-component response regulator
MTDPDTIVFIVDDDLSVRRSTERLIRSAGFKVPGQAKQESARDAHQAGGPPG